MRTERLPNSRNGEPLPFIGLVEEFQYPFTVHYSVRPMLQDGGDVIGVSLAQQVGGGADEVSAVLSSGLGKARENAVGVGTRGGTVPSGEFSADDRRLRGVVGRFDLLHIEKREQVLPMFGHAMGQAAIVRVTIVVVEQPIHSSLDSPAGGGVSVFASLQAKSGRVFRGTG
jgi:hypothetical protein